MQALVQSDKFFGALVRQPRAIRDFCTRGSGTNKDEHVCEYSCARQSMNRAYLKSCYGNAPSQASNTMVYVL